MHVKGNEVIAKEVAPGIIRKVLTYSEDIMVCEFNLKKGAVLSMHNHPHIQNTYIAEGCLKFTVNDEEIILRAGDSILMKANDLHGGVALEDSKAIDVFSPMREDFL